jgi:hypothetical protein
MGSTWPTADQTDTDDDDDDLLEKLPPEHFEFGRKTEILVSTLKSVFLCQSTVLRLILSCFTNFQNWFRRKKNWFESTFLCSLALPGLKGGINKNSYDHYLRWAKPQ